MYNKVGEWTKAHEQYRALQRNGEPTRPSISTCVVLTICAIHLDLLSHHESGHDQEELSEAQS
jgi:hypothetical protein